MGYLNEIFDSVVNNTIGGEYFIADAVWDCREHSARALQYVLRLKRHTLHFYRIRQSSTPLFADFTPPAIRMQPQAEFAVDLQQALD